MTLIRDGESFACLDGSAGVLHVEPGPPPSNLGIFLPNPFFESLQFLFPMKDANALNQVQLPDAWDMAATTDLTNVEWETVGHGGPALDVATFPGASYQGVAYDHHVYVPANDHSHPASIDRVDDAGNVLTRTSFAHYERVTREVIDRGTELARAGESDDAVKHFTAAHTRRQTSRRSGERRAARWWTPWNARRAIRAPAGKRGDGGTVIPRGEAPRAPSAARIGPACGSSPARPCGRRRREPPDRRASGRSRARRGRRRAPRDR